MVACHTPITPAVVGVLASVGAATVPVYRRPRVAILATGDELVDVTERPGPGQIRNANGYANAAQVLAAGGEPLQLPIARDTEADLRAQLQAGLDWKTDLFLTSGGVSVGPHDLVRRVEAELGVEEVFWRVAVKPGKPIAFGVRGRTLVFGLPGNPVSALVGFELFVRPAVLALQGAVEPLPRFLRAVLRGTRRRAPERDELVRARLQVGDGGVEVEPLSGQESHMIARAAEADALVLVPRGDGELVDGSIVEYLPLA